jgi:two-component sensor histidine kinase
MISKNIHFYFLFIVLIHNFFSFSKDFTNNQFDTVSVQSKLDDKLNFNANTNLNLGEEFFNLAKINYKKGEFEKCKYYLDSADFYSKSAENLPKYADILLYKGRVNKKLNNYSSALNYFKKALIIYKELEDFENIATVELNVGNVLKNINKYKQSHQYYSLALDHYSIINDKTGIGNCYNNIGNLYKKQGNLDSSKFSFFKSLKYRTNKDSIQKSYAFHNIANLYIQLNQLDSALYFIDKSIKIKYNFKNKYDINSDYVTLGEILAFKKDYANSNYYLNLVLDSEKSIVTLIEAERIISNNYLNQKDFKNSSLHYHQYFELTDSLNQINQSEEIENKLIEYEMVKDSLENQQLLLKKEVSDIENENLKLQERYNQTKFTYTLYLLAVILLTGILIFISFRRRLKEEKQHKAKLEVQNEELKRTLISNEEKEVLLKEIHHRVKNNLQIINSLIRLQSHYMTPNNYLTKLNETENRIRSMALVHEKLYQSKELSKLNVNTYIKELVSNIYESYETGVPINFEYEINELKYSIDTLIPIGLIINEVISNSLKYAFQGKESGQIYIKFCDKCYDKKTVLIIKDNGIGADLQFEELSSDSLGLELIESLTEQLDGEFELETEIGFSYFFSFPSLE